MSAQAYRLPLKRADRGVVMGTLPSGLDAPVWREDLEVDVKGRPLVCRCDVPVRKDIVDIAEYRGQELFKVLCVMAKAIEEETDRKVEVLVEKDVLGVQTIFFECSVRPLAGVEKILVRGLAHRIHDQHPKWPREKVSEILALARLGKGPYAREWERMCARGPSKDDAPVGGD